jgi:hypothetical protein
MRTNFGSLLFRMQVDAGVHRPVSAALQKKPKRRCRHTSIDTWALQTCPAFSCLARIAFYQAARSNKTEHRSPSPPFVAACASQRLRPPLLANLAPALPSLRYLVALLVDFLVPTSVTPASRRCSRCRLQMGDEEMWGASGKEEEVKPDG